MFTIVLSSVIEALPPPYSRSKQAFKVCHGSFIVDPCVYPEPVMHILPKSPGQLINWLAGAFVHKVFSTHFMQASRIYQYSLENWRIQSAHQHDPAIQY